MNDELGNLPLVKAPDSIWKSIEATLDAGIKPKRVFRPSMWGMGLAAAAALGVGVFTWYALKAPKAAWDVMRLEGTPSVGSRLIEHGKIEVGEWLQTDASSRARIAVGDIGTVEVAPNTRVRMVVSRPGEQRLRLAHGEISASVSAPPRLFFVDTPSSTAVDLGCAYTMKADGNGDGLLRVTLGWVALEWEGRESLVPAGASCRTRQKVGPATPYFEDASQAFLEALGRFDDGGEGKAALDTVLAEARVRDTLTLWHLLSRVELPERQRIYNRIVELVPLPKSVSPVKALELDSATLKLLREELAWKW